MSKIVKPVFKDNKIVYEDEQRTHCCFCHKKLLECYINENSSFLACQCGRAHSSSLDSARWPPVTYLRKSFFFSNGSPGSRGGETKFRSVNINSLTEEQSGALLAYRMFMDNSKNILIISGPVGVGKTHILYSLMRETIANELCKRENDLKNVRMYNESLFFDTIKSSMDKNSEISQEQIMYDINDTDYYFWDDFGSAAKTIQGNWAKEIYYKILDGVIVKEKKMIITTNYSLEDLRRAFSEFTSSKALFSRLTQGEYIEIVEKDMRLSKSGESVRGAS